MLPRSRRRRLLLAAVGAFLATTGLALTQSFNLFFRRADGAPLPVTLGGIFLAQAPLWYSALAVSPLVALLCRRFPFWPRPRLRDLALHGLLALPVLLLAVVLTTLARAGLGAGQDPLWIETLQNARNYTSFFCVNYLLVAGLYSAYTHAQREERLAAVLSHVRLEQLTAQLQPHFLFNALHGVSALIGEDPAGARRMLWHLAALLRSSLEHEDEQEVPLRIELEWLLAYTAVQHYRYPQLQVQVRVPEAAQPLYVPRFVLQPLVENCVRHALEATGGALRVEVAAEVAGETLRLSVRDDGPGFARLPPASGIGLGNLEQRLRALHGDGRLQLRNGETGGAVVELTLPARPARSPRIRRTASGITPVPAAAAPSRETSPTSAASLHPAG